MHPRQRLFVVLSCFVPSIVVAIVALVVQESSLWLAFGLSLLAGGIVAAFIWKRTQEAQQAYDLLQELRPILENSNEESEKLKDILAKLSATREKNSTTVVKNLTERLIQRRHQLNDNAVNLVSTFLLLADPRKVLPLTFNYSAPDGKYEQAVANSFSQLMKSLQISRQRLEAFSGFLREMPAPLIVTDNQQRIITANPAAEKLFELSSKQLQKIRITKLLTDSVTSIDPESEEDTRPLTPFQAMNSLKKSPNKEVLVQQNNKQAQCLKMQGHLTSQYSEFVFRSVQEEMHAAVAARLQNRQHSLRQIANYLQNQMESPISKAVADLRVMAGTIKRLPQKDQMLPALTSCQQNLGRMSLMHDLLDWFYRLETKRFQFTDPEEVKLSEVTDKVETHLQGWMTEKKITLDIVDEGAWAYADEGCLATIVAGMLTHAIAASTGEEIELVLGRSKRTEQDQIELRCNYKSKPVSAELLKDLDNPYRRINSSLFDSNIAGSALGLYVAKELAKLLGGDLKVETIGDAQTRIATTFHSRPNVCSAETPDYADGIEAQVGQFRFGSTAALTSEDVQEAEFFSSEKELDELYVEAPSNASLNHIDINVDDTALVLSDTLGDWQLG